MRIVVLDGHALNPGDLSWEEISELGDFTDYERTPENEVLNRSAGAEILFTNKTVLNADIINELPHLKYIGVLATGYNVVDIEAARKNNIVVTNIPSYGTESVAQMVFALILEFTNNVALHSLSVGKGKWVNSVDWCYWEKPLIELAGLTMGIIGFGRIGKETAKLANAFSMKVIATDVNPVTSDLKFSTMKDLNSIFKESDIISLHCPLTEENYQFVDSSKIKLMKESAILINTSRGKLINEKDLAEALNNNKIAGAGLDLLSEEPPNKDNPLLTAKNCIITPHIAWATYSARKRLMSIAAENLKLFLLGKPQNVIT